MRKVKVLSMFVWSAFVSIGAFSSGATAAASSQGVLPTELSGLQAVFHDVLQVCYWLIWTAGPVFFLIALFHYMKTNDAGEKKDMKKWMTRIALSVPSAQLVVWLLQTYLVNKFTSIAG